MKVIGRQLIFLLVIVLSFFIFSSKALAEEISDFKADIAINADGTLDITESIQYDFGTDERHGIFRDIDLLKENAEGKQFILDVDVNSVTDENGKQYQYEEIDEGTLLQIKIGDPDRTIRGEHEYKINYSVAGALTYFSDHDELYWNVTGNGWQIPIDHAIASITLPSSIPEEQIRITCYTGSTGSTTGECLQGKEGSTVTIETPGTLQSYEGLTIVVGFPKGTVAVLEPREYKTFFETFWGKVTFIGMLFMGALWYFIYPLWIMGKWYTSGRDPVVGGPVAAWYDPPKTSTGRKLLPAEAGTLIDEIVHVKDISSTIVDLGRRGYLKIEERKKNDFYLTKTNSDESRLVDYEKRLLDNLFSTTIEIRLKDKKLVGTIQEIEKMIYNRIVADKFFDKDPNATRTFYSVVGGIAFITLNIPLALIAFLIGRHMPKKTLLGAEQAMVARSLKNFLKGQERQLTFQAKNQMWFEKLLPYAVAFGVEKYWAEQFKDIAMKQPDWYSTYDNRAFSSIYLTNHLASSFSSFERAATPTSSSSGFSSGFSGGSSGGGGGGGGGGSW